MNIKNLTMNKALMVMMAILFAAFVTNGQNFGRVETAGLQFSSRSIDIFGTNFPTLTVAPSVSVGLIKNVSAEAQLGTIVSLAAAKVAGNSLYGALSLRYERPMFGSWKLYGDAEFYSMSAKISDNVADFQQEISDKYSTEFYSSVKAAAGTRMSRSALDLSAGTSLEWDGMIFSIEKSLLKAKDFAIGVTWHF